MPNEPLGQRVIGSPDLIKAFTPEAAQAFHARWYTRDNSVIVLHGPIDKDAVAPLVARHIAPLPVKTVPPHEWKARRSYEPGQQVMRATEKDARQVGIYLEKIVTFDEPEAMRAEIDATNVVLAGYLQLVPPDVTRRFAGRMLNVHPAPLPAFGGPGMYGIRVHRAVLASGVRWSGPTVHFVDELYDHGATIAHWQVPVIEGDDEHTLAARVLRAEHLLFPRVVLAVASGALALGSGDTVALVAFDPSLDDAALRQDIDHAMRFERDTRSVPPIK